jgi:hypothetical protein
MRSNWSEPSVRLAGHAGQRPTCRHRKDHWLCYSLHFVTLWYVMKFRCTVLLVEAMMVDVLIQPPRAKNDCLLDAYAARDTYMVLLASHMY